MYQISISSICLSDTASRTRGIVRRTVCRIRTSPFRACAGLQSYDRSRWQSPCPERLRLCTSGQRRGDGSHCSCPSLSGEAGLRVVARTIPCTFESPISCSPVRSRPVIVMMMWSFELRSKVVVFATRGGSPSPRTALRRAFQSSPRSLLRRFAMSATTPKRGSGTPTSARKSGRACFWTWSISPSPFGACCQRNGLPTVRHSRERPKISRFLLWRTQVELVKELTADSIHD